MIVELTIDHPLAWISGGWEWRFPTVVAPRYLGGDGTVRDAEAVTVDVVDGATSPTASVTLTIADDLLGVPTSSTHAITVAGQVVTLTNDVALDRDLVIRWPAPHQAPGCTIRTMRSEHTEAEFGDSAFGLLTIVPPTAGGEHFARDLVLLLDVSGSMNGRPLQHLKGVVNTLIDSLDDDDRLEIIAFSSGQVRYHAEPVHTTAAERRKVRAWIEALKADGGTELISAIGEALRPLRQDVPRQVVIVTDGLIGFEAAAVRAIRDALPAGSRLHTVGVGSASNRAFLRPAARAGRGIEVLIDLDEPATRGAERISAATREPVVMDVVLDGTALLDTPPRLPDLLSGSPVLAPIRLKPQGGTLVVRGRTARGPWEERLDVAATAAGEGSEAVLALWARERIEDLELDLACGAERNSIDRRIEQIALQFSVSSRLTSWIAIAEETGDPREPVRTVRIPQALPYGMSVEGLGLVSAHRMMARHHAERLVCVSPTGGDCRILCSVPKPLAPRSSTEAKGRQAARPLRRNSRGGDGSDRPTAGEQDVSRRASRQAVGGGHGCGLARPCVPDTWPADSDDRNRCDVGIELAARENGDTLGPNGRRRRARHHSPRAHRRWLACPVGAGGCT